MYFEYSQYVGGCLILPLLVSLSALGMLIGAIGHFVTVIRRQKLSFDKILNLALAVLVCGFFLCMNLGRLCYGGIHLLYERETQAITFTGEISEMKELDRYSFPELKNDYGYGETNGVELTIGNVKCAAVTAGQFEVGDEVTITYLPQSGYVLSIFLYEG